MNRSVTRQIDFQRPEARGGSSVLVVRLIMACNDMRLATEAASQWNDDQSRSKQYRQVGARMYFIRPRMAHPHEALRIIEDIRDDDQLMKLPSTRDGQTQASFRKLTEYLRGGANHSLVDKIIGKVRHNLTFHDDQTGKWIGRAISELAAIPGGHHANIVRGGTPYLWHFEAGDEIVDQIVVRYAWQIPHDRDLREEPDAVEDQLREIFLAFMDFSGEFIWKYAER